MATQITDLSKLEVSFGFAEETENYYKFKKPRKRNQEMFPDILYLEKELFPDGKVPPGITVTFKANND